MGEVFNFEQVLDGEGVGELRGRSCGEGAGGRGKFLGE
jgi:hypothetical protein